MGECSSCEIIVATVHADAVREFLSSAGGFSVTEDSEVYGEPDTWCFCDNEAVGGGHDTVRALAGYKFAIPGRKRKQRIPFTGGADAHRYSDWPASVFASDGRRFIEAYGMDGADLVGTRKPAVRILENGKPDPKELRDARLYWRVKTKAERMMAVRGMASREVAGMAATADARDDAARPSEEVGS